MSQLILPMSMALQRLAVRGSMQSAALQHEVNLG